MTRAQASLRRTAAEALARQMAIHAFCDTHSEANPDADCPFCQDRAAYALWLASGGKDYRVVIDGTLVPLTELIRRYEAGEKHLFLTLDGDNDG